MVPITKTDKIRHLRLVDNDGEINEGEQQEEEGRNRRPRLRIPFAGPSYPMDEFSKLAVGPLSPRLIYGHKSRPHFFLQI